MDTQVLIDKFMRAYKWVVTRDYTNPAIALTAIAAIMLPFVAKLYVMTGLMLGLVHAVGILWLLEKCPNSLKRKLLDHPLIADVALSFGAVYLVGGMFGHGLTLGLGALFCTVIMSLCLPHIKMNNNEQQRPEPTVQPA